MTRSQLLDSQGPLTKKNLATIKELIEEFVKHSREYHNSGDDVTVGKGTREAGNENLTKIMAKVKNMDRRMTKMDQSVHSIQVGCGICNGPYLTRDCDLDENGNQKAQVCSLSGDKYDDDWRKPRNEWLPYYKYKKQKDEKYRKIGRGFYQEEQPPSNNKSEFELMLARFAVIYQKGHDAIDSTIRNQQATIKNMKTQLGQMNRLVNDRLPLKNPEPKE